MVRARVLLMTAVAAFAVLVAGLPTRALADPSSSGSSSSSSGSLGVVNGPGSVSWTVPTSCGTHNVLLGWNGSVYGSNLTSAKLAIIAAVKADPSLILPVNGGTRNSNSVLQSPDAREYDTSGGWNYWMGCFSGSIISSSVTVKVPDHIDNGTITLWLGSKKIRSTDLVVMRPVTGQATPGSGLYGNPAQTLCTPTAGGVVACIKYTPAGSLSWNWGDGSSDHNSTHTYKRVSAAGVTITASQDWKVECRSYTPAGGWTSWGTSNCTNVTNGGVYTQTFTDPKAPRPVDQIEPVAIG